MSKEELRKLTKDNEIEIRGERSCNACKGISKTLKDAACGISFCTGGTCSDGGCPAGATM